MFFEQQMEELTEDFGLGGKMMKFWECNQMPGEIIYIPAATIMTSLNIHDAFRYCNTLQLTATHCNALQHTATHCNTLQHTATRCNNTHAVFLPRPS